MNFLRIITTVPILLLFTLTSCGDQKEVVISQTQHEDQTIVHDIETIANSTIYPNGEALVPPGGIVIKSLEEWSSLKNKMNQINHETKPFDDAIINFETEMIIGYFDEVRGSTGHSVSIESVTEKLNGLHVNHTISKKGDMGAEVLNQPYSLVKMRKRNKKVIFAPTL